MCVFFVYYLPTYLATLLLVMLFLYMHGCCSCLWMWLCDWVGVWDRVVLHGDVM